MPNITLLPTPLDITLYAGDGFTMQVNFKNSTGEPVPMTGTWAAHIRQFANQAAIITEFDIDATNAATGVVVLRLTGDQTSLLPDKCSWDFQEIPDSGQPRTWYRGTITPVQDFTRITP